MGFILYYFACIINICNYTERKPFNMKENNYKVYKIFKFCQLTVLTLLFISMLVYLKFDKTVRNNIYTNKTLLFLCVFIWISMLISFICIIIDLRQLERYISETYQLNRIAYTDSLTGLPNRLSCDTLFEKYDNTATIDDIAVALITITNLTLINEALGHEKGDNVIKDFVSLFEKTGEKYGFVGRNGGNEFLIVIEHCDEVKMAHFLDEFSESVNAYNSSSNQLPVTYKSNTAFNISEEKFTFGELVSALYKSRGSN